MRNELGQQALFRSEHCPHHSTQPTLIHSRAGIKVRTAEEARRPDRNSVEAAMPWGFRIWCDNQELSHGIVAQLHTIDLDLNLDDSNTQIKHLVVWIVGSTTTHLAPKEETPFPIVLISLVQDFSDEELSSAGVTAYAGPGTSTADIERCLIAAARGQKLFIRAQKPSRSLGLAASPKPHLR